MKIFDRWGQVIYQSSNPDEMWDGLINGEEVPVIQRTPVNAGTNDRYGFEFNLNYSPSKKWRINSDFNFFKSISILKNYI